MTKQPPTVKQPPTETPEPNVVAVTGQINSPPTYPSNRIALAINATDIILSLGAQRMLFQSNGEPAGAVVEYHSAHSMSPISARQLMMGLQAILETYEAQFGAIPVDTAGERKFSDGMAVAKRQLSAAASASESISKVRAKARVVKRPR